MFFKYFSRQILFSRTFQDSPVYSSTFQACANPVQAEGTADLDLHCFQNKTLSGFNMARVN